MTTVKVKAYAKINLSFEITGIMDNGYHSVETLMQSVDLYDTLELVVNPDKTGISLSSNWHWIPTDDKNLAIKAVKVYLEKFGISTGVDIKLTKCIPSQAGMAGGSADGAAALVAINKIFGKTDINGLLEIGKSLGADLPFCIVGGSRVCTGFGEILGENIGFSSGVFLLVKPNFGNKTPEMFKRFDRNPKQVINATDKIVSAIRSDDLSQVGAEMYNCFEEYSVFSKECKDIKRKLICSGALGSCMTGSGSVVVGLFADEESAKLAEGKFSKYKTFISHPINRGVQITE